MPDEAPDAPVASTDSEVLAEALALLRQTTEATSSPMVFIERRSLAIRVQEFLAAHDTPAEP